MGLQLPARLRTHITLKDTERYETVSQTHLQTPLVPKAYTESHLGTSQAEMINFHRFPSIHIPAVLPSTACCCLLYPKQLDSGRCAAANALFLAYQASVTQQPQHAKGTSLISMYHVIYDDTCVILLNHVESIKSKSQRDPQSPSIPLLPAALHQSPRVILEILELPGENLRTNPVAIDARFTGKVFESKQQET